MSDGPKKPSTRKVVDWDLMEPDYRANVSLAALALKYGCSDAAIVKHAKKFGWARDLAAKIKEKADAKVRAEAVRAEVRATNQVNDQAVIEANAEVQFRIRMEHRTDIGRTRALFRSLLGELEVFGTEEGKELLRGLIEVMNPEQDGDDGIDAQARAGRMAKLFERATSRDGRVDHAKKLTEMLEKLVRMEREAFGITDGEKDESQVEELLRRLGRE